MMVRLSLVALIMTSSLATTSATATCEMKDRNDCRYTVICEVHAGNVWTPECTYEPYVTFVITKSELDTLTAGFFGSTNFDSRVREIKAIDNTWTTIETLTWRYYSKTVVMDLSSNKIENIKNDAFRNLIALESLNISNNYIQSLNSRSFLISESKASELYVLDLSNNLLTDLTEDYFQYVPSLSTLYLQNNKLVSLSEDSLSNTKNLTDLNLRNNKITDLNMTLINLKALKYLDVSHNLLNRIFGYELNRLVALERLNMSHNSIEFIDSNCFERASSLWIVDLSNNRIKSPIESLMFINNNKLKYLDLYENNINHIQDNAFQNNQIAYLNLDKNNLTGEITQYMFRGLQNLTSFSLRNQSITVIKQNAFSDALGLEALDLSQNNIQLIENSSFSKAPSLNILIVTDNKISNVDFLRNSLVNLTELNINNNNLVKITQGAFDNQTSLKKLHISGNKIESIEPFSLPLKTLEYLDIRKNSLHGTLQSNIFSPGKLLRSLDLSDFNFTRINEKALVDLPLLARLNISHNELKFFDPNNLVGMDNMYSLDLSYNKLPSFYLNNSSLINLKALYLNNNNLLNISLTLINMTKLLYLDMSNNNISDLSDVPFTMLPDLKVLHLSNNKIKIFNNPQINSLIKLTGLNLSGNQLTEINLSCFPDLVIVDVSHNQLNFFNSSFFTNLDFLQSIDISGNNIQQLVPGTFQYVKILKFLNLSNNKLINLRYGSFRGLNRTEVLDLSYNHLADIDVDVFHECFELKRLTIDYNNIKTIDVERLVATLPKLTTLSLGGNPLSCKEIVRNIKIVNKNLIRQVDVTSLDKIYHEDNVHGIKCGDTNATITTTTEQSNVVDKPQESNFSLALVIWCSLLTLVVLGAGVGLYYFKIRKSLLFGRESRMQLGNSVSTFSDPQINLFG